MRLSLCVCHTVFTRMESCLCTRWAHSQRDSTPAMPQTRRETWLAWPKWRSKVSSCWRLSIRLPAPSGCAVSLVVSVTLRIRFTPLTSFVRAMTENELAAESSWRSQYQEWPYGTFKGCFLDISFVKSSKKNYRMLAPQIQDKRM